MPRAPGLSKGDPDTLHLGAGPGADESKAAANGGCRLASASGKSTRGQRRRTVLAGAHQGAGGHCCQGPCARRSCCPGSAGEIDWIKTAQGWRSRPRIFASMIASWSLGPAAAVGSPAEIARPKVGFLGHDSLPFGPMGPRPVGGFRVGRVMPQRTRIGLLDSVGFCVSRMISGSDDGGSVAGSILIVRRAGPQRALGQPGWRCRTVRHAPSPPPHSERLPDVPGDCRNGVADLKSRKSECTREDGDGTLLLRSTVR